MSSCISLESLRDDELIARLVQLRRRERETTLEILKHLIEIERRKLHLKLGYSSMFVYCTEHLRYSESAAGRRVAAARCIHRVPEVEALLERGEVNLMTLGLVSPFLSSRNAPELLGKIRSKTKQEVERIVAEYRPSTHFRDRVQHVRVPAPCAAPKLEMESPAPTTADSPHPLVNVISNSHCGSEKSPKLVPTVPKLQLQFVVGEAFMRKYNEACALLSNKIARPSFEAVFETLLDDFIERKSPRKRLERRILRLAREQARTTPPAGATTNGRPAIPARTRDAVFVRDKGQCTFVGKNGKRCGGTRGLQVDHVTPVARNGTSAATNLRLLCARHNLLEAERILGYGITSRYRGDSVSKTP